MRFTVREETQWLMWFGGLDLADFHWVLTQTVKESWGSFHSQVIKYSPHIRWIIYPVLLTFTQRLFHCFVSLLVYCNSRTRKEILYTADIWVIQPIILSEDRRSDVSWDIDACILNTFTTKSLQSTECVFFFQPLFWHLTANIYKIPKCDSLSS